jgi:transposase
MGYLRQQEIRMTVRPVVWVGIDAGKATHHAAAVNEQGQLCWSQRAPNDQAAIEELRPAPRCAGRWT